MNDLVLNVGRSLVYAICFQTAMQAAAFNTDYKSTPAEIHKLAWRWYTEALAAGERPGEPGGD